VFSSAFAAAIRTPSGEPLGMRSTKERSRKQDYAFNAEDPQQINTLALRLRSEFDVGFTG
jgi:hypothetical protein